MQPTGAVSQAPQKCIVRVLTAFTVKKDFVCPRDLLLQEMKYFEDHLPKHEYAAQTLCLTLTDVGAETASIFQFTATSISSTGS